jgi:hypothetical protein
MVWMPDADMACTIGEALVRKHVICRNEFSDEREYPGRHSVTLQISAQRRQLPCPGF